MLQMRLFLLFLQRAMEGRIWLSRMTKKVASYELHHLIFLETVCVVQIHLQAVLPKAEKKKFALRHLKLHNARKRNYQHFSEAELLLHPRSQMLNFHSWVWRMTLCQTGTRLPHRRFAGRVPISNADTIPAIPAL